jgi:hypothetical protein
MHWSGVAGMKPTKHGHIAEPDVLPVAVETD